MKPILYLLLGLHLLNSSYSVSKPNILFIMSDDHAAHGISAYGGRFAEIAPTPNLDRLAKEGALFKNAFCTNSICSPSRACVLTGQYNHVNGAVDLGGRVEPGKQMLAIEMGKAGYETAMIGKWHLHSNPVGFDFWRILPGQGSYYNPDFIEMDGSRKRYEGYGNDKVTEFSLEWLKNGRDKSKPFVMMSQFKAPHRN